MCGLSIYNIHGASAANENPIRFLADFFSAFSAGNLFFDL
jgi:hypothetical protein